MFIVIDMVMVMVIGSVIDIDSSLFINIVRVIHSCYCCAPLLVLLLLLMLMLRLRLMLV